LKGLARLPRRYAALVAAVLIALALPSTAHAAFPGANGRIAWASNEAGSDLEIVSAFADGSGFRQETTNTTDDREPAWSPDGTKIAYSHFNGSGWEIWVKDLVANTNTPLVTEAGIGEEASDPSWRRDGAFIAFTFGGSPNRQIYLVNASAPNSIQPVILTGDNLMPAYAPNSFKIAFSKFNSGTGHFALQTVNDDGGSLTPLVSSATNDLYVPNWAPGDYASCDQFGCILKLAYTLFNFAGSPPNYDLYTIHQNGLGNTGILTTTVDESNPAWAPEGNMIAYERAAPANSSDTEIYTASTNGGAPTPVLTRPTTTDSWPDWQPVVKAQVRPKAATPMYLPLVPAFVQCTNPNATHETFGNPPQTPGSCVPPRVWTSDLTIGEPQVNGKPTNFVGSIKITALSGNAQIAVSLTDVRCARTMPAFCAGGPYSDYTWLLHDKLVFRLTDRSNTAGTAGTVTDIELSVGLQCAPTADTTIGSTCQTTTTLNSRLPGIAVSGRRATLQLISFEIDDINELPFVVPAATFIP
jgi:WD40-like Beta Propeller Repeat